MPSAKNKTDRNAELAKESKPLFIDTNIFVYAAGVPGSEDNRALQELESATQVIIQALGEEQIYGVTSVIVLQEILYLFNRWAHDRKEEALKEKGQQCVSNVLTLMEEVFTLTYFEFTKAFNAYDPYRDDINDLLILEVMRSHEVVEIMTADKDFARYEGIEVVDPQKYCRWLEE